MDHDPGVLRVLGRPHLDRQLKLVGESACDTQGIPGVRLRGFPLLEQLGECVELFAELVQAADRVELALVSAALPKDFLGLFRARPEIRCGCLAPQPLERAPRGVLIKGSPGAKGVAPRRL
jgi:hypothetical protein